MEVKINMKITKSWRSRGQLSAKFLGGILGFGLLAGFLVPQVWAVEPGSGVVKDVTPGAGTLKAAVKAANEGDTLRLKPGSYTGNWNDGRRMMRWVEKRNRRILGITRRRNRRVMRLR